MEPTPVKIANIKHGKKNRNNKHEGLRVLIDTGCSHSIILEKYIKQKQINKKNMPQEAAF